MLSCDLSAKEFIHELYWWQDLNCMWTFGFTNITIWFWYKFWNYTILWYKINTHLLTNFTSVSREFSQTHTFSSIFVTDLVRSPVIGAIASCENQGQKITIDCVLVWHLTRNIHNFQHDIFDCWKFNCPVETNLNLIRETSIWSS